MSFFISDAVAATGAPAQGSPMSLILMLVVFGLIFYFMILRPQQKRTHGLFSFLARGTRGFDGQFLDDGIHGLGLPVPRKASRWFGFAGL